MCRDNAGLPVDTEPHHRYTEHEVRYLTNTLRDEYNLWRKRKIRKTSSGEYKNLAAQQMDMIGRLWDKLGLDEEERRKMGVDKTR